MSVTNRAQAGLALASIRSPSPPSSLIIDLDAIVANWRLLGALARSGVECAAVVKADAYGLGAQAVSRALFNAGCRTFFVAVVQEGLALSLPDDARVFVLHGPMPGEETVCAQAGLIPILNSPEQLGAWREMSVRLQRALPCGLQIDTGMARVGFQPHDWAGLRSEDLTGLTVSLLMSHLVAAEETDHPLNRQQLAHFQAARALWPGVPSSFANSSGIFLGQDWHFDLLRPGAALYGVAPITGAPNPMQPVVSLQGRLIQTREIDPGQGVGYNHTWRASRRTRLATISVGYADGYFRSLSNRAQVRFAGKTAPLVGRVSMDTITVDVTDLDLEDLQPGASFDLINSDHDINALAEEAGTNAYEILTNLGARYHRTYLSSLTDD